MPEAATGCVLQKNGSENFVIFTGKHLCWNLFLIKLINFLIKLIKNTFFEENLRTAASVMHSANKFSGNLALH